MTTINAVNTTLSGQTGTGNFVGANTPTLITPLLGTPTSGTLTNCLGLPYAGIASTAWTDLVGTITVTGFSGSPTVTVHQVKMGKVIFIRFSISGTSNATTFTITNMPNQAIGSGNILLPVYTLDNGTAAFGLLEFDASTTTVQFFKDATGAAFTNSGTKAAVGCFFYEAA